jgi:hypothetical protein
MSYRCTNRPGNWWPLSRNKEKENILYIMKEKKRNVNEEEWMDRGRKRRSIFCPE